MADPNNQDNATSGGSNNENQTNGAPSQGGGFAAAVNHMMANKVDAALWMTRMFTVIASVLFVLPIFATNSASMYQRVLLSNAATSALRLHQRIPNFQFSREFFGLLFVEDSAHYLFYSLIFLTSYPITMVLMPIFLYALLHATSFTIVLLNQIGDNSIPLVRNLIGKIKDRQVNILRFVAMNEIFLMPAIVVMVFSGQATVLLPFIYYRFLSLRYSSRRNPYCRTLFYELRVTVEQLCIHQSCPGFVRNICHKAIAFICRLAPQVAQS